MASARAAETRRNRALEAGLVPCSAGVYAGNGPEPLLPGNLALPKAFDASWRMRGKKLFAWGRALTAQSDFARPIFEKKLQYFSLGFELAGSNPDETAAMKKWADGVMGSNGKPYRFDVVAMDAWVEWLTCDNLVAFWMKPEDGAGLSPVTIMDCEDVRVDRNFGGSVVTVKPKQVTLKPEQRKAIGKRWADAIEGGAEVTLDESLGERWEIMTCGKSMGGLSSPRVEALCDDMMQLNLLKLGDLAGGWTGKDLITQVKKGHEIKQGPKAGMPDFFLKKAEMKVIEKLLQNKGGAFKIVSNFDLLFRFIYLDPKFFDSAKYSGVMQSLERWAGPLAQMLKAGVVSEALGNAFKMEGLWNRERMAGFLGAIFNNEDFICGAKDRPQVVEEKPSIVRKADGGIEQKDAKSAKGDKGNANQEICAPGEEEPANNATIKVEWDPFVFDNMKTLMEWVRTGANGLVPPQTARQAMRVNDRMASAHMRETHLNPLDYTPPFEPRQGMLRPNGRPGDNGLGGEPDPVVPVN